MKTYAVLTGDLVASSQLAVELRTELVGWLKELGEMFAAVSPEAVVGSLDVFRGDSWQLCLQEPALAVKAAVFFRAGLKGHPSRERVDTRVGIGIGTVEHLVESRISESTGPAFVSSGESLDALKEGTHFRLMGPEEHPLLASLDRLVLPLLDIQVGGWSHPESVAVLGALMGWTQQETAAHALARKTDGKQPTQQAIQDALDRVHWSPLFKSILEESIRLMHAAG